jgi:putative copper resistance protein D
MGEGPIIAARIALFGALTLLFGLSLFGLHGLRGEERHDRRLIPFSPCLGGLAAIGLVASAFGFVAMAAAMAGTGLSQVDSGTLTMLLGQTAVGAAFQIRMAALVLCLATSILLVRHPIAALGTIAVAAGTALATLAWSGHGAATDGGARMVHLGADILHLLAAGAWIGAVGGLLFIAVRTSHDGVGQVRTLHRALDGFAAIGTVLVALILITGGINALFLVGVDQLPHLAAGLWGRLMLAKIALFIVMLAMAATNRFRLTPRLERAIGHDDHGRALGLLRRSLALEMAAAMLILGLVGWLGTLEPVG